MPYSVTDLIRFYNSPFSYWCYKTNKLVEEKKINEKYKISINQTNLISPQLLKKAEEHEIILKDRFRITEKLNLVDMSNKQSTNETLVSVISKKPDVIFQPYIETDDLVGRLDFIRVLENTLEIIDAKLSFSVKENHLIQLCAYKEILENVTGIETNKASLFLGDLELHSIDLEDIFSTYIEIKNKFIKFNNEYDENTAPFPKKGEDLKEFDVEAKKIWKEEGSLEQIYRIQEKQIEKLKDNGIYSISELKNTKLEKIEGIGNDTFNKYKKFANLLAKSSDEEINYEIKDKSLYGLLPQNKGDLYIDFEGYPFLDLKRNFEYLYGIWFLNEKENFKYFWSDNEDEEEESFVDFINYLLNHLKSYPEAKFYHYFSYEITSLKKSAEHFNKYESEVRELIESNHFIDLFKIVNSSLLIGASSYSLKTVEKLAGIKRTEDLQSGMESIKSFEEYYFNEEYDLKDSIIDYNKADCRNLYLLHEWLVTLL